MSGSVEGHPREQLSDYLDDELSVEERNGIDRHLASCESCRSELDALRRLSRAIADEAVPPPPADLHERIGRRLDEATVSRPRRWRLALPATIAATISALGILVAVQWREGRLTPPAPQEVAHEPQLQKENKQLADAAPPPASPPPAPRSTGDVRLAPPVKAKPDVQGARERDFKTEVRQDEPSNTVDSVAGGVPAGVVGGVVGGVPEGVEGGEARDEAHRALAAEAPPRPAAADAERYDKVGLAPKDAAKLAATLAAVSTCADRWSDSGVRGTWEVGDPVATARELNGIAHDVGGIALWRGVDDGRPYLLIVPRSRYAEVFYALRARGIAGLVEPPALAPGDDCTALSITIVRTP